MILAIDVQYNETNAVVAGVAFDMVNSTMIKDEYLSIVQSVGEYVPGQFYLRELPCIAKLLEEHNLTPKLIIVDGYAWLDANQKPGLGKRLYDHLGGTIPVIGVAKNPYKDAPQSFELLRGESKKPLHVSSEGISLELAKDMILSMSGKFRIPTLLKRADQLCRSVK